MPIPARSGTRCFLAILTIRREMQYQFAEPFIVDSSKIANALGVHATPVEQALANTLATYHPGPAQGRRTLRLPRPSQA